MNTKRLTSTLLMMSAACGGIDVPITTAGDQIPAEVGKTYRLSFDDSSPNGLPDNLVAPLGDWAVEADPSAISSPNVLRQRGSFSNPDFPRIALKDLVFTDTTIRVRCKLEEGSTDRACGIMFRFQDSDNYLITRANALEDNIRVYRVVGGSRSEFASVNRTVSAGDWHDYVVTARGDRIVITFDGSEVITTSDKTFASGKVGLWTKADSITAFDDFEVTAE